MTLAELRMWHLTEAGRLLLRAGEELHRLPMRVSTADVAAWRTKAQFHLDAVELVDLAMVWERDACGL